MLVVGEGCLYQLIPGEGVDADLPGLQLNVIFQDMQLERGVSCDSARPAVPQALAWGSEDQFRGFSPNAKA